MSLAGFQTALGRSVRHPGRGGLRDAQDAAGALDLTAGERAGLSFLLTSRGFLFTVEIQRSWCASRAATTARQTLSVLSAEERQRLLVEWIGRGGGTNSFVESEAEAFLEFIASRLPDPSHARTLCRLEQATYRVNSRAGAFVPRHRGLLRDADTMLQVSPGAALVAFFVEPDDLVAALRRSEPVPRYAKPICHLLFAPGIPGLFRRASNEEVRLWETLSQPVQMRDLLSTGHSPELIGTLVAAGAVDASGNLP